MELKLIRTEKTADYTHGKLYINEAYVCDTLEDAVRIVKIPGKTAILPGRYRVLMTYSNRFGKIMPELQDVPEFKGVRIHAGNTVKDTEGCILCGTMYEPGVITNSRTACGKVYEMLDKATDKIYITIQ